LTLINAHLPRVPSGNYTSLAARVLYVAPQHNQP
jgi:hypothetical protein